jgi:prophage regulatory protein
MSARFSTESTSAATTPEFSLGNGIKSSSDLDRIIFLRLPEVKAVTGLSKTTIYERIREAAFPLPVPIGKRAVGWVESEVKQWAANRVLASRAGAPSALGKRPPHPVRAALQASPKRFA